MSSGGRLSFLYFLPSRYNAVAESFFQLLKRERIKRRIYTTRSDARADVFDYIEMFYNRKRRHGFNNQLSPVVFEEQFNQRLESV
jgi:putative transposase